MGLSGTGKTTTTFTRQNGSLPVQDDFVAWWPDGRVSATEAGCFAKTFALNPRDEPTIHGAVTKADAYLENVSMTDAGEVDFFDESYTKNGRAVFSFNAIDAADATAIEAADFLLVLNKNENVIPAVAKMKGPQAAAFFMLGETTGTAAGGSDEEGKFLRVPGTNPFFPMHHDNQGNRFLELLERNPIDVYVMNTGRVGGKESVRGRRRSRSRTRRQSSRRSPKAPSSGRPTPTSAIWSRPRCPASTRRTSTSCSRGGCTRRLGEPTSTPSGWCS